MLRRDCAANQYVANILVEKVEPIFRATADCIESFDVDDIVYSAGTDDSFIAVPCECKTLKGGYQFQYSGDWNTYFTTGIYNKLVFKGVRPDVGTPIYFVNATDSSGDFAKGKYRKILDSHGSLTFLAPDCILFYTKEMLEKAFCGYADYYVRRTTEFGGNWNREWEPKALIRLDMGLYIPCNPPTELFRK